MQGFFWTFFIFFAPIVLRPVPTPALTLSLNIILHICFYGLILALF